MKKIRLFAVLLMIMMLCACSSGKKEDEGFDLSGKTYYNTIDEYGNEDHSKVWFGKDGSFVFRDNFFEGYYELEGTWSVSENVATLNVEKSGVGNYDKVIFEIKDADTLVLKTSLAGSFSDQIFSTTETKGSTADNGGGGNTNTDPEPKDVPCTGLTSKQNYYWAKEGVKDWDLEIKATPSNTTDKMVFKSNDESVVKIDDRGHATTVSPGKTTIDVTCGSQKLTVEFETKAKGPDSVSVDPKVLTIYYNNTGKIDAKTLPEKADQTVTFTSADPGIAKVDGNGNVTGMMPGKTKITVTAVNGVYAEVEVNVEGEAVVFSMDNYVSVKAGSGQKIPYSGYLISYYDGNYNKQDVTLELDFHTTHTSALDIDGNGCVYAKGAIFETTDVPVYFTFSDGSSLYVTSETYYVHVEK